MTRHLVNNTGMAQWCLCCINLELTEKTREKYQDHGNSKFSLLLLLATSLDFHHQNKGPRFQAFVSFKFPQMRMPGNYQFLLGTQDCQRHVQKREW